LFTVVRPSSSCSSPSPGEAVIHIGASSSEREDAGLLSSQVTEVTGCGTADWPWLIKAGDGQRVNITLYDFSHEALATRDSGNRNSAGIPLRRSLASLDFRNSLPFRWRRSLEFIDSGNSAGGFVHGGRTCKVYATIRDGSGSRSTTICGGRAPVTHVFLSTTSRVEIRLLQPTAANVNSKVKAKVNSMSPDVQMPYFLLRYEGF